MISVVELAPSHLGRTSLVIDATVRSSGSGSRQGEIVHATGKTRLVRLDPATFTPAPWSDRFRAAIGPLIVKP